MEYFIFILGTTFFGLGFFLLLLLLYLKKKLVTPFVMMGLGVIFCFVGLILAQDFSS